MTTRWRFENTAGPSPQTPVLAIAALRLAIVADQTGNSELEADAIARAWRHREELDTREQALLLAFAGPRYPQPSPAAEQLRAWTDLANRELRNADGWSRFAARLFHEGDRLGSPQIHEQTLTALRRALAIDTAHVAARIVAAVDARTGDSLMPDAAEPKANALTTARAIAMAALWTGRRPDEGREAINRLEAAAVTPSEAVDAVLAEYALTSNQGRTADAFASTNACTLFGQIRMRTCGCGFLMASTAKGTPVSLPARRRNW